MQPGLLAKAKQCGTAELSNVALLFYTRKDEEGGGGYEFLHKSFGEYLTARGLISAFQRWGAQAIDENSDFSTSEFLQRWLRLAGPSPITREILSFLRNEARLQASLDDSQQPWESARKWAGIASALMDLAIREGVPAHLGATNWRSAEAQENNAEVSLMALVDSWARAAFPAHLRKAEFDKGGWGAGPVKIPAFEKNTATFVQFLKRCSGSSPTQMYHMYHDNEFIFFDGDSILNKMLTRLSLRGVALFGTALYGADLEGCDFSESTLFATTFVRANLAGAAFRNAEFRYTNFERANLSGADLRGADLDMANFGDAELDSVQADRAIKNRRQPKGRSGLWGRFIG